MGRNTVSHVFLQRLLFLLLRGWKTVSRLGSFPRAGSLVGLENLGNRIVISSVGVFVS